jgi:hypothetical protein
LRSALAGGGAANKKASISAGLFVVGSNSIVVRPSHVQELVAEHVFKTETTFHTG